MSSLGLIAAGAKCGGRGGGASLLRNQPLALLFSYRSASVGVRRNWSTQPSYKCQPQIQRLPFGFSVQRQGSHGLLNAMGLTHKSVVTCIQSRSIVISSGLNSGKVKDGGDKSSELLEANAHAEEQEREHVFSESHFRDTIERLDVQSPMSLDQIGSSSMQANDRTTVNDGQNSHIRGMANYEGHQYSNSGSVSLSSVMQSNVPEPFKTSVRGSPSHMNMPGGGARQADKYLAGHLKDVHPKRKYVTSSAIPGPFNYGYVTKPEHESTSSSSGHNNYIDCQGPQGNIESQTVEILSRMADPCPQGVQGEDCDRFKLWLQNCVGYGGQNCDQDLIAFRSGRKTLQEIFKEQEKMIQQMSFNQKREFSTSTSKSSSNTEKPKENEEASSESESAVSSGTENLSQKDRLKRAVKDYGATVVVFHVTISLMSLGTAYLAVSSGLDVVALLEKMGVGESRLTTGASTFVMAYALHKIFAPVRIATTLTATPFIVRYLRKIGFLKPPKGALKK